MISDCVLARIGTHGALTAVTLALAIAAWTGASRAAAEAPLVIRVDQPLVLTIPLAAPAVDLAPLRAQHDRMDALLYGARFEEVIAMSERAREVAARYRDIGAAVAHGVRIELMIASAQVALGQRGGARDSLLRARRLAPRLELSEAEVSPKLLTVFRALDTPSAKSVAR